MFVVVSRHALIDSRYSAVICAPAYCRRRLGNASADRINEGLKHESSIHCDELVSLLKSVLTNYVGTLSTQKLQALDRALRVHSIYTTNRRSTDLLLR